MIVFTKPVAKDVKNVETGEVEKKGYQVFRYYRVFNRDQTDAPKVEQPDTIPAPTPEDVEQILGSLNLAEGVIYGGDRACYMPSRDGIRLPNVGDSALSKLDECGICGGNGPQTPCWDGEWMGPDEADKS